MRSLSSLKHDAGKLRVSNQEVAEDRGFELPDLGWLFVQHMGLPALYVCSDPFSKTSKAIRFEGASSGMPPQRNDDNNIFESFQDGEAWVCSFGHPFSRSLSQLFFT